MPSRLACCSMRAASTAWSSWKPCGRCTIGYGRHRARDGAYRPCAAGEPSLRQVFLPLRRGACRTSDQHLRCAHASGSLMDIGVYLRRGNGVSVRRARGGPVRLSAHFDAHDCGNRWAHRRRRDYRGALCRQGCRARVFQDLYGTCCPAKSRESWEPSPTAALPSQTTAPCGYAEPPQRLRATPPRRARTT